MLRGCSDTKNVYTSFLEEGYKRWLDPAKKFYRAENKKKKQFIKRRERKFDEMLIITVKMRIENVGISKL